MKTLKVLVPYMDIEQGRYLPMDYIFEINDERADQLLSHPSHIVEELDRRVDEPETLKEYDLTPPLKTPEEFHKLTSSK